MQKKERPDWQVYAIILIGFVIAAYFFGFLNDQFRGDEIVPRDMDAGFRDPR